MHHPCSEVDIPQAWLDGFFQDAPMIFYIACGERDHFATLYCSPNVNHWLGYRPTDFLADPLFRFDQIHPEDVELVCQELFLEADRFRGEDDGTIDCATARRQLEYRFRHRDGGYRWLRDDYHFVRRQDHHAVICGWWFEITEHREEQHTLNATRRKLEEKKRFIQRVLDNIPQQIFWKDRHSVFQGCNLAAAQALNLADPAEIVGKTDHDLYLYDHLRADYLRKLDEKVMVSGRPEYHHDVCQSNTLHELTWLDVTKVPLATEQGGAGGILICIENITKRKQLETTLRTLNHDLEERIRQETEENLRKERLLLQQGRHTAMGEMIGNIGHQWRQPLSTLSLILQNLAWECRETTADDCHPCVYDCPTKIQQSTVEALRVIQQMSTTIDDFRNFFKPSTHQELFCPETAIKEASKLLRVSFRHHHISCRVTLPKTAIKVWGNANEFSQVILNLLANAKDIIMERKVADGRIRIQGVILEQHLILRVRDNGGGVPVNDLERLFDPYFTTKAGGTGIGLYISRAIIERRLGGSVSCRNTEEGAEFQITLPLSEQPPATTTGGA